MSEAGTRNRNLSKTRRLLAVLVGAFLCLMLSAAFFPTQLAVEAQPPPPTPAGPIKPFEDMWKDADHVDRNGRPIMTPSRTAFCGTSKGLLEFKKINFEHWRGVPGNTENAQTSRQGFFLTLRIISCMIGTQPGDGAVGRPGAILFYGRAAVVAVSNAFTNIILAVATLALVLLGVRVILGRQNEFLPNLFTILMKIGLLVAAIAAIPTLYDAMVGTLNEWSGTLALKIPSHLCPEYKSSNFSGAAMAPYQFLIPWAKLDCAAQSMVEVGQSSINSPIAAAMISFLSPGIGKGVTMAFIGSIYALGVVMEVAIMILLLAHMAIIMLMMIAPLAWACIFFQKTRDYFTRWLGLLVGFIMQPILLTLFLMMFITIFESVMCSTPYSVVAAFNKAADGHKGPTTNPFVALYAPPPNYGKGWGPSHCTVPAIQRAFMRVSALSDFGSAMSVKSKDKSTPEDAEKLKSFFSQMVQGGKVYTDTALKEAVSKFTGYVWPSVGSFSLSSEKAKLLGGPFLALFTAFIILFVLFNFLKQLPEFVNLLAAAAVESGNINKVNRIGGDFGKSAMSGIGGMNRGFEQGLRGSEGSMAEAQKGLASGFRNYMGRG